MLAVSAPNARDILVARTSDAWQRWDDGESQEGASPMVICPPPEGQPVAILKGKQLPFICLGEWASIRPESHLILATWIDRRYAKGGLSESDIAWNDVILMGK